ncbi:PilZ domain-containing protein [Shewanella youngdeokensis]|uniref:PilZ domain-containing protein n=1 Tax=Shewanella youngdeokensis TaxID=2999068 RepID=A0ABZ0JWB7_9GAMM|nr:PilZ domain-containing protein [Shewanella sp. DAU334]
MTNLVVNYTTVHQLYRAYMPFIKPAGLFIDTTDVYFLGQSLSVSYQLPGAVEQMQFEAVVVWINPLGASGGRPAGVGVKISSEPDLHKHHIEQQLSAVLSSGDLTCTM